MTRSLLTQWLLLAALIFTPSLSFANTFVVDKGEDSHDLYPGDGIAADSDDSLVARSSLRAAIEEANSLAGPDTILLISDSIVVRPTLGTIAITDNSTVIMGNEQFPIIDGAWLPYGYHLIEIEADSCEISGVSIRRSRFHGVVVRGSENRIGGATEQSRNIFLGCGLDYSEAYAVAIIGEQAQRNIVGANWFGLDGNGTEVYGNSGGILISEGASFNQIGSELLTPSCFVSGSTGWGVTILSGAHDNLVQGCVIGLDLTWLAGPGNCLGGVRLEDAHNNRIGGETYAQRNVIAANDGPGILLSGIGSQDNLVSGNFIGIDSSGLISIANQNGMTIENGAHQNQIGDELGLPSNVISGNHGTGVAIRGIGTDNNRLVGNYIGPSYRGGGLYAGDTYGDYGVTITDRASHNEIGSSAPAGGNVISLNADAGVLISSSGTTSNILVGNFIGITAWGISSAPNGNGVIIRGGASDNLVGGYTEADRNIISGNRAELYPLGAGVAIYDPGTNGNIIAGNYIGLDYDGVRALRNGSCGVIIGNGAQENVIGGSVAGAGNVISGNGVDPEDGSIARGITIADPGTAYNRIEGNLIGPKADKSSYLSNRGTGIGLFNGAHHNRIGGDEPASGNLIAGNERHGILIDQVESRANLIRNNIIGDNDSASVKLNNAAQDEIAPPIILLATTNMVQGEVTDSGWTIDLYRRWTDPLVSDFGNNRIGSAVSNAGRLFEIYPTGLLYGDSVWAIATNLSGSSSAFSLVVPATLPTDLNERPDNLPDQFTLGQNYPNPFNPSTSIEFSLPSAGYVTLRIYNSLGQTVASPVAANLPTGQHVISWNGLSDNGERVASGVYFYRLDWDGNRLTRTALLLK